ncbi:MAG: FAD-dependent thymidylate synthase [Firmicutes bacterium]|nr:FAD-dependent thymidylate synthase [Bacillota bacterium]
MKIIRPKVLIPAWQLERTVINRLERYARVCYKSEENEGAFSDPSFLKTLIARGHESVIEHEKVTALFVIDRGVSHELVRHRIGSYSQESTRYCNYSKGKYGAEITVIEPFFFQDRKAYQIWEAACRNAEQSYLALIAQGCTAQEARSVLPNSLKTEVAVTFNYREWRHFFRLRASAAAHPQMKQVAIPLLLLFQEKLNVLFEDLEYDRAFPAEHYAEIILTDELFR